MSYVIIGGTGTVGTQVVEGLLDRNRDLRVVTRSPDKLADVDVEVIEADMTDPTTFEGRFQGSSAMFLLNPVSQSELQEGLFALAEAKKAGMEHIVYVSVHDVEKGPHLPHFASKIAMEDALKSSGIDWTILRPNNFHQNDYWFRDVIVEHGIYPQPLGSAGVSRVDVRDIAAAAVHAFEDSDHRNRAFTLAGPEPLSGEDCARIWSEALGRDVSYGGDDLEAWEQQARQMMPAWMTYDFRLMYDLFQAEGLRASPAQLDETRAIVGGEPRSLADFARETAAQWA